jgi:CRISPR/Cas system CSM-associated protein Csm3 (group 7 of RAMP superfamily)
MEVIDSVLFISSHICRQQLFDVSQLPPYLPSSSVHGRITTRMTNYYDHQQHTMSTSQSHIAQHRRIQARRRWFLKFYALVERTPSRAER